MKWFQGCFMGQKIIAPIQLAITRLALAKGKEGCTKNLGWIPRHLKSSMASTYASREIKALTIIS
jgi:hypothetical protein